MLFDPWREGANGAAMHTAAQRVADLRINGVGLTSRQTTQPRVNTPTCAVGPKPHLCAVLGRLCFMPVLSRGTLVGCKDNHPVEYIRKCRLT